MGTTDDTLFHELALTLLPGIGPQLKEKIDVVQSLEKVRAFLMSLKKEVEAAGKADV